MRQLEDQQSQKAIRQQITNRKKTYGGNRPSVSSVSSNSGGNNNKFIRKPFVPSECSKCIVLEDMLNESRDRFEQVNFSFSCNLLHCYYYCLYYILLGFLFMMIILLHQYL